MKNTEEIVQKAITEVTNSKWWRTGKVNTNTRHAVATQYKAFCCVKPEYAFTELKPNCFNVKPLMFPTLYQELCSGGFMTSLTLPSNFRKYASLLHVQIMNLKQRRIRLYHEKGQS